MKFKVHSPYGVTDNFDVSAGVLIEDTATPNMFIFCRDYELCTSIDLGYIIVRIRYTVKQSKIFINTCGTVRLVL